MASLNRETPFLSISSLLLTQVWCLNSRDMRYVLRHLMHVFWLLPLCMLHQWIWPRYDWPHENSRTVTLFPVSHLLAQILPVMSLVVLAISPLKISSVWANLILGHWTLTLGASLISHKGQGHPDGRAVVTCSDCAVVLTPTQHPSRGLWKRYNVCLVYLFSAVSVNHCLMLNDIPCSPCVKLSV